MLKNTKKNIAYILTLAGLAAFVIYAAKTGLQRQARIDCLDASRICDQFRDVHGGKCAECQLVSYCIKENLI